MQKHSPKQLLGFIATSIIGAGVVMAIHFWPGNNSMLNLHSWAHMNGAKGLNNTYLTDVVNYHKTEAAFAARPVTTWFIEQTSNITGLPLGWSFTLINFLFLCIAGVLVSLLSKSYSGTTTHAYVSQIVFWLSFPVLFAFFPMIYSYDDPLQYALILAALVFLANQKHITFIFFYMASLIVRESGLILLPGLLIMHLKNNNRFYNSTNLRTAGLFVLPALGYFMFSFWYVTSHNLVQELTALNQNRWVCFGQNFGHPQFRTESLISFLLVSLLPLVTWPEFKQRNKKMAIAFLIALILNTVVVFLFTRARESRLFFLPLLLWLPHAGPLLLGALKIARGHFKNHTNKAGVSLLLIALAAAPLACIVYQPTGMQPYENWHQEYLFVLLTFAAFINLRFTKT